MNPEIGSHTFKPNRQSGISYTRGVALIALIMAPGYLYFIEDIKNIYALIGTTILAGVLPFVFHWIRRLLGGIETITISDDEVYLERKKRSDKLTWLDMAEVEFETINNTPWLTLVTNAGKKQKVCLEDFEKPDQQKIYELIVGEAPDITRKKTSWIIGNRIPVSYNTEIKPATAADKNS